MTAKDEPNRRSSDPRTKALGQAMLDFLEAKDVLLARAADFGMTSGWGLDEAITHVWDGIDEALSAISRGKPLPAEAIQSDTEDIRTGAPGRPSKKGWYNAEHERRCRTGEAFPALVDEAKYLLRWLHEEHKGQANYPTPGAIRNEIRRRHRSYKMTLSRS
jgi:hypothetical protein